ncbi:MAG: DUF1761 family protein [Bacteriovoracaceae bacterium]|nr:DUF1761 domain-containing protein [Bacteroidota bacterium]
MPFDISLNIPGIFSAAFICFAFLALWFSKALFGPLLEKVRTRQPETITLPRLIFQGLFVLLFCIVMEVFVDSVGAVGMSEGVYVGVAVWLLVSLIHLAVSFKFDGYSMFVKAIYSSYFLVASVISAALLSMWR